MPNTAELRSIYSGPIRRALDAIEQRLQTLENADRVVSRAYQWKTDTTATDPGTGFAKANNASPGLASALYVSAHDKSGSVIVAKDLRKGDQLWVYIAGAMENYIEYKVTATPTLNANSWWTVPVSMVLTTAFAPGNNTDVVIRVRAGATEGTGGAMVLDPAYAGPGHDQPSQALFSRVGHGGRLGMAVQENANVLILHGAGQATVFYEAIGPNSGPTGYRALGSWEWGGESGRLTAGGLCIGDHPSHASPWAASIYPSGRTAQSEYILLTNSSDQAVLLNSPGSLGLRHNNVQRMNIWGTHTSFVNAPVRIETTAGAVKNFGVGNTNPENGGWGAAHIFCEGTTETRIALANSVASQLRVAPSADSQAIAGVNSTNSAYVAFKGLAYVVASTATIKERIRTLRPQRERIVVRRDPLSDVVAPPDIMGLRPVVFRPKIGALDADGAPLPADSVHGIEGTRERLGLIAEDVQYVIPSAVAHAADGQANGIMYDQITVALLDHVQRLTETVNTLQYRIAELERSPA